MRVFKFRGKSIETGKWVYGDLIHRHLQNPAIQEIKPARGSAATYITWTVDPETVSQFTGAYDYDGKEIYENDILKHIKTGYVECIEWDNNYFCHVIKGNEAYNDCAIVKSHNYRIIGNSYDNPELVEEDEDEDNQI